MDQNTPYFDYASFRKLQKCKHPPSIPTQVMPKNDMEQKLKSIGFGRRTSGWSARNDFTRIPPMECEIMLAFLPPDASNMLSSFTLNFSMCSASLHTHFKHIRKTYKYNTQHGTALKQRYALCNLLCTMPFGAFTTLDYHWCGRKGLSIRPLFFFF